MNRESPEAVHTHTHTHTHGYNLKDTKAKKRIYGFIKLVAFLIILCICLEIVSNTLKRKEAYTKMSDFFNQQEDFDVLFFGSSHMYTVVYPMQLWKDYGIVSYNMGQMSATTAVSYHNLILACKEHKPKMVVVDTYLIDQNYKVRNLKGDSMHNTFDPYPLSYDKYLAIKDLCEDGKTLDNIAEYLFNFSIYHARWKELNKEDFITNRIYGKGAEPKTALNFESEIREFETVETYSGEETTNMKYLRKIIEYCHKNGIEILVTYMPYPALDEEIAASKYVQKICDDYDVEYINFLEKNIVNYNTDCSDKNSHLNTSGGRKVTRYIGKYLTENYNIPDQRENKLYESWNDDYNKYVNSKIRALKEAAGYLNRYVMLLYGEKDISYKIKISSKRKIEGTILNRMLKNINNRYEIDDKVFEENPDKTVKITTWDRRNGKEIDTVWF